ncbi:sensor domain-containing diguanylate cyclase [Pokkaliibacter plantistimulans]|nr:GGDEF domain-containing protein [Pokkaliibacter plantistimulans]
MLTLKVGQKFWLGSAVILVGLLVLSSELLFQQWQRWRNLELSRLDLADFHSAMLAFNAVSAERGPANNRLTAAGRQTESQLQLDQSRRETNLAFDQLEVGLREQSYRFGLAEQFQYARHNLTVARARVDEVATINPGQRQPMTIQSAIDAMFGVINVLRPPINELQTAILQRNPHLTQAILTARVMTELRDYYGRLGSALIVPLNSGSAIDQQRQWTLFHLKGRISQLTEQVDVLIKPYQGGSQRYGINREQLRNGLQTALAMVDKLMTEGLLAGRYSMTAREFTDTYVPNLNMLERYRDRVMLLSQRDVVAATEVALGHLVTSAVLSVVVTVILLLVLWRLNSAVLLPLLRARNELLALASGELKEPPAIPRSYRGEIRQLYVALDILRQELKIRAREEEERAAFNVMLKVQAETDPLTGLFNRRTLEIAGRRLADYTMDDRVGLILLDIDCFKRVNDDHGHLAGDEVLKEVARRLRQRVPASMTLARYGGEEFAILCDDAGKDTLLKLADVLRLVIASVPIDLLKDVSLTVTASAGVAMKRADLRTWHDLFAEADRALYQAKAKGRNCVVIAELEQTV